MDHATSKPRLALTMGDPAGVGPEIVAKVCSDQEILELCDLVVVGREMLFSAGCLSAGIVPPTVELVEAGTGAEITPGIPSKEGGEQSARFIETAAQMCLDGQVQAMVTAPINKYSLQLAGVTDTGHTTMLARITNTETPVMMLAGSKLRVILATIHCAYREVLDRLSEDVIIKVGSIAHQGLKIYFGLERPRIAVAALNPHAGEDGMFGDEEGRIIAPAIERMKQAGIMASGPYPPDTIYLRASQGEFDLVLGMYHDQALIPLKLLHFDDGVNVTLGLPIIRTSVDHGTAYDIAGTGKASPESLKAAIITAANMVQNARRFGKA